jgi:CelD/BcsL family acetyltransferase involved in cellulose biosynthesis
MTTQLSFEVVSTPEALRALEPEWRDLSRRAYRDQVFQTFEYVCAGWECVASPRGRDILVIIGRLDQQVVLIWPLATHKSSLWSLARALDSETTEYRDIVVEDTPSRDKWVSQAWDFAIGHCGLDVIYLQYVPADGPLETQLHKLGCVAAVEEETEFLDRREFETWEDYYGTLGKHSKSDLRRRRRRLNEAGAVDITIITDRDEMEAFMTWLFDMKTTALAGIKGPTGWFTTDEHRKFLPTIAKLGLEGGPVVATALKVDGQFIAGKLDLDYKSGKVLLVTTYDPAWRRYSPGQLLYERALEEAFEDGKETVDFRIGGEEHKAKWVNRTGMVREYWVPCTWWGRIYIKWRLSPIRSLIRKIARRAS